MKVGIAGAAGYTAGELIRILIHHPHAELKYIQSESHKGEAVCKVHRDLLYSPLIFSDIEFSDIDVLFLCMGHGASSGFLSTHDIPEQVKIIDLSNDFRLQKDSGGFVYGLPELFRETIKGSSHIANPGCFATAIELGLLPIASINRLPEEITVFGITGSTGAGQKPSEETHFSNRNNNLSNYKVFTHQHLDEIHETLAKAGARNFHDMAFVPVRVDWGFVGDIEEVNAKVLADLIENKIMPVMSPITFDRQGQLLNTNADSVASAVAVALSRMYETELAFCMDKPGVLLDTMDNQSVIGELDREGYHTYLSRGIIHSGMIPKLDNAFKTIDAGVRCVRITNPYNLEGGTVIKGRKDPGSKTGTDRTGRNSSDTPE